MADPTSMSRSDAAEIRAELAEIRSVQEQLERLQAMVKKRCTKYDLDPAEYGVTWTVDLSTGEIKRGP